MSSTERTVSLSFERSTTARFGTRVVAPPRVHPDPSAAEHAVRAARRAWEDRARQEYVGVLLMRHVHGLLVDVNAPMDVQEAALAFALEEQRHTAMCVDAARSLGSDGVLAFALPELQRRRRGALHEELLDQIVGLFVVSETVALDLLVFSLRSLPRSTYRDVLRAIARDEVGHARFGPALLGEIRASGAPWLPYPGDAAVAELARDHVARMRARDVVHEDERAMFADPALGAALRALGVPVANDFVRAYHRSLDVSVPAALARAGVVVEGAGG